MNIDQAIAFIENYGAKSGLTDPLSIIERMVDQYKKLEVYEQQALHLFMAEVKETA
mgnify:CR=1 FL=1